MHFELNDQLWAPEGPVALPDGGFLVVEMRRGTLTRISPEGQATVVAMLGGSPNGAALGPLNQVYVCNSGGFEFSADSAGQLLARGQASDYSGGRIERVDLATGVVTTLYTHVGSHPLRGPNDLVLDGHGGFWFTDLGSHRARDMDWGGIYYARLDGSSVEEVVYHMVSPNGIALSPDGRQLYVAETLTARLLSFEVQAPGQLQRDAAGEAVRRCVYVAPDLVKFDSIAVEDSGNICIAVLFKGSVITVSPGGDVIDVVETDDVCTTNICFGGSDMHDAYITLAARGVLLHRRWPRAGLRLRT